MPDHTLAVTESDASLNAIQNAHNVGSTRRTIGPARTAGSDESMLRAILVAGDVCHRSSQSTKRIRPYNPVTSATVATVVIVTRARGKDVILLQRAEELIPYKQRLSGRGFCVFFFVHAVSLDVSLRQSFPNDSSLDRTRVRAVPCTTVCAMGAAGHGETPDAEET